MVCCSVFSAASLTVSPDRSQFFKYESLSLSCEDNRTSSRWTVKAKTIRGVSECGRDWGFQQGSTCTINEAYSWNSGVYWCESTSGETSPAANISVTGEFFPSSEVKLTMSASKHPASNMRELCKKLSDSHAAFPVNASQ